MENFVAIADTLVVVVGALGEFVSDIKGDKHAEIKNKPNTNGFGFLDYKSNPITFDPVRSRGKNL